VETSNEEEVKKVIKALKLNKAPGLEEISLGLCRSGRAAVTESLFCLTIKVWNREHKPSD
jgi:hypothetical protein